jgi:hypothetical protein
MAFRSRQFGSKQVSQTHNRAALHQVIIFRENLDGLDPESLSRSYGVPVDQVRNAIAEERTKRAAQ